VEGHRGRRLNGKFGRSALGRTSESDAPLLSPSLGLPLLLPSPCVSRCLSRTCVVSRCISRCLCLVRVLSHAVSLTHVLSLCCLSLVCCPIYNRTFPLGSRSLPPLIASRCSRCALAASRCLSPRLSLAVRHDDFIRDCSAVFLFKPSSSLTASFHSLVSLDLLTLHRI
jgi:hypothetical protein